MKTFPPRITSLIAAGIVAAGVCAYAQSPAPSAADSASPVPAPTPSGPATLTLDLTTPGAHVSPTLYGLMTEEINHSYDGGLYAETIQNRIFRDFTQPPPPPRRPAAAAGSPAPQATPYPEQAFHWSLVQDGGGAGTMALDDSQPVKNTALTTCLKLDVTAAGKRVGVANDGYWGIPVRPSTTYKVSYYAKTTAAAPGPLTVSIESADGSATYATAEMSKPSGDWQQYTSTLTTGADVKTTTGRFVLSTATPGTYWINLVSLFQPTYHDRPNGNRADIMQLLADMKPTFLRLPGGNFLEGDHIADRFPWDQTLGDLAQRPGHNGCWNYRASDGMGLLEYLEWCEDINVQPVLAVYAGYSLRREHIDPGPSLQPFVDSALNEIEYVTGDATTKWGAVRAKDGHPKPFPLTYVEIGNEDGFDTSHSYDGRFGQFYDAIKAKYPNLKLIATAGGKDSLGAREKVTHRVADAYDEHYYRQAGEMEDDANHYDHYSRTGPKTFVGEWATREGSPTTNMNAALGDAAWMTGMERNSDVVVLASYAPLFVNVSPGAMQWPSDLVGYDTLSVFGSPSYYAQKMFGNYLGDTLVPLAAGNVPTQLWQPRARRGGMAPPAARTIPALFFSATRSSGNGALYLKVVNAAATAQQVDIELKGAKSVEPSATSVVLSSASPTDTNSINEPTKITPVTSKIDGVAAKFSPTFAPYSVTVLQLAVQ